MLCTLLLTEQDYTILFDQPQGLTGMCVETRNLAALARRDLLFLAPPRRVLPLTVALFQNVISLRSNMLSVRRLTSIAPQVPSIQNILYPDLPFTDACRSCQSVRVKLHIASSIVSQNMVTCGLALPVALFRGGTRLQHTLEPNFRRQIQRFLV